MSGLDLLFMRRALALAGAQLGRVAPNPAVGCVIVRDARVCGEGATADGGRPHAEQLALREAGDAASGADIFVTLEPCAKRSDGGLSCAEFLIAARPARVLIACADPHPYAAGAGLDRLRAAGIAIEFGLAQAAAEALNIGFFTRVRTGQPFVDIADSPDGYDAELVLAPGESLDAALTRLGDAGITRAYVSWGSASAAVFERTRAARSTRS